MTSFNNNEEKVCLLLKNDVSGSRIRSHAKPRIESHDYKFCDHGITF